MANSRFYSSIAAVTNLQATAGPGDTTIQVASSSGFPNSFPYTLSLDYGSASEELVDVTGGGPSVFNVTRAVDGTSATTHNAGAVVRHVTSARDFTDSRTHEASTSNVHGITGAFVDTLSTQTLQNKTLSSPVINNGTVIGSVTATGATVSSGTFATPTINNPTMTAGGALGGTFSGAPDFSGGPTFSSGLNVSGSRVSIKRAATSNNAVTSGVTGETNDRYAVLADGTTSWGSGSAGQDVNLFRVSANTLQLSGNLTTTGNQNVNGSITTPGALSAGNLVLTNQSWTSFVPVWHGHNANMSTNTGWYTQIGKLVHFTIYTVFSTSSSLTGPVRVDAPVTPYRGSAQFRQYLGTVWYDNVLPGGDFPDINCMGQFETFASDGGTNTANLVNYKANTFTGGLITGPSPSTIITITGTYRAA